MDVDALGFVLDAASDGVDVAADRIERRGQRNLCASERVRLPASVRRQDEIEAMGIVLMGGGGGLFQDAELPSGWRLEPSDHSMWSYVVDEGGNRRVSVFYKASPWDTDAFMRPY